jgi:hypothetical protein
LLFLANTPIFLLDAIISNAEYFGISAATAGHFFDIRAIFYCVLNDFSSMDAGKGLMFGRTP